MLMGVGSLVVLRLNSQLHSACAVTNHVGGYREPDSVKAGLCGHGSDGNSVLLASR